MKIQKNIRRTLIVVIGSVFFLSCKKFVDVGEPKKLLSTATIFSSDATATSALLSIYAKMDNGFIYRIIYTTGMSGDEMRTWSVDGDKINLQTNNLSAMNTYSFIPWEENYRFIYQANAIIEGLTKSGAITQAVRRQLEGEARFIRAFCYFNLVNYFGNVPIVNTTDYVANSSPTRSAVESVYDLIEQDLEIAKDMLSEEYKDPTNSYTNEKVRPNISAANALLSRVLLYRGKWSQAESVATSIIVSGKYALSDLNEVFLKNSSEAIWQIMSVNPSFNTVIGDYLTIEGSPQDASLQASFVQSFQSLDKRRHAWIGQFVDGSDIYYFSSKYKVTYGKKPITEYTMVFRLAEQYLIRAEASAQQDRLADAEADLNIVRIRAGLLPLTGLAKQALLDSIQGERKFELFAEAGDRWFNLKRTNTVDAILSLAKGADWQTTDQLYPIPSSELLLNPNLKQNPGY